VVDAFPCQHQLFLQVSLKAAGECTRKAKRFTSFSHTRITVIALDDDRVDITVDF